MWSIVINVVIALVASALIAGVTSLILAKKKQTSFNLVSIAVLVVYFAFCLFHTYHIANTFDKKSELNKLYQDRNEWINNTLGVASEVEKYISGDNQITKEIEQRLPLFKKGLSVFGIATEMTPEDFDKKQAEYNWFIFRRAMWILFGTVLYVLYGLFLTGDGSSQRVRRYGDGSSDERGTRRRLSVRRSRFSD